MSEENVETAENTLSEGAPPESALPEGAPSEGAGEQEAPKELTVEQAFNLLVNLARQSKLSYDEHALVDRAVQTLAQALNPQQ